MAPIYRRTLASGGLNLRMQLRTTTWPMFCTNCVRRFSKSNWRGGTRIHQLGREIGVSMSFATGLITNTIPCWLISVKNRSPSSENVMCATQQSRDLVLANHTYDLVF